MGRSSVVNGLLAATPGHLAECGLSLGTRKALGKLAKCSDDEKGLDNEACLHGQNKKYCVTDRVYQIGKQLDQKLRLYQGGKTFETAANIRLWTQSQNLDSGVFASNVCEVLDGLHACD